MFAEVVQWLANAVDAPVGLYRDLDDIGERRASSASGNGAFDTMRLAKAIVDLRGHRIILGRLDTTVDRIPTGPMDPVTYDVGVDDAELGAAVLLATAQARLAAPPFTADEKRAIMAARHRAAGVRSWRSFVHGCRSVNVFETDGALELVPLVNLGPREGFGAAEASIYVRERDATSVGVATRAALDAATPRRPSTTSAAEPCVLLGMTFANAERL